VFNSFKIGTAFGIPIRIHWTFVVMILVLMMRVPGSNTDFLLAVGVLLTCVLLHELGHSLVARRFGIRVIDITFWPLGGMARMSQIPESSKVEGLVAIAGPAVNFVLAAVGVVALILFGPQAGGTFDRYAQTFVFWNLGLGIFNLVPAFPMDGGRILRAFFARNHDWLRATEMAVSVGRLCAGMMFAASLAWMMSGGEGICLLPLIPLFIWVAGGRELLVVRLRHAQMHFGQPFGSHPGQPESQTGRQPNGSQPEFGQPPEVSHGQGSGFSDADIRTLEQFRGRMRPPD
jgi:Zn-dependent protease